MCAEHRRYARSHLPSIEKRLDPHTADSAHGEGGGRGAGDEEETKESGEMMNASARDRQELVVYRRLPANKRLAVAILFCVYCV